jgi:hypothetical protein
MGPEETSIILLFLSIMLLLLFLSRYFIIKNSAYQSFIFSKKIRMLNWLKLIKIWIFIQVFVTSFSFDRLSDNIFIIVLFSIILTGYILINALSKDIHIDINESEYDNYKKSFSRQKKINKILKI